MAIKCKTKYSWYQTDTTVNIDVLRLNVDQLKCVFLVKNNCLSFKHDDEEMFSVQLLHEVDSKPDVNFTSSKCEIKLKKLKQQQWERLDKAELTTNDVATSLNTLSEKLKRFDDVAREVDKDPECQNKDGVNSFFQDIYKNMDDDGRRAMAKSYVESAGTVLSTNWKDVQGKKVEVKPPDGMEFKQYEQ